jgi:hypothetical protein
MTEVGPEARQRLSAALFNNTYFAEVVLTIAGLARRPEQFVTTRKIASASGLGDSLVRPVVLRLEAAELLYRLPRLAGRRGEQHFERYAAPHWNRLVRLCASLSTAAENSTDDRPTPR